MGRAERLRHMVAGVGAAVDRISRWSVPTGDEATSAPKLRQHDDGTVLAEDLELLLREEQTAAQRQDYRRAQLLSDIRHTLGPKPPLSLEDCAPTDVDAQVEFFLHNGVRSRTQPAALRPSQPEPGLWSFLTDCLCFAVLYPAQRAHCRTAATRPGRLDRCRGAGRINVEARRRQRKNFL